MLQYNGYNIRVIEKNDNEQVCGVIKGVFYELGLPLVGTKEENVYENRDVKDYIKNNSFMRLLGKVCR